MRQLVAAVRSNIPRREPPTSDLMPDRTSCSEKTSASFLSSTS